MAEPMVDITVSTLNNQKTTMKAMEVNFQLESSSGKYRRTMTAYTTDKAVGFMKVMDWRELSEKWPHLAAIPFPTLPK